MLSLPLLTLKCSGEPPLGSAVLVQSVSQPVVVHIRGSDTHQSWWNYSVMHIDLMKGNAALLINQYM